MSDTLNESSKLVVPPCQATLVALPAEECQESPVECGSCGRTVKCAKIALNVYPWHWMTQMRSHHRNVGESRFGLILGF